MDRECFVRVNLSNTVTVHMPRRALIASGSSTLSTPLVLQRGPLRYCCSFFYAGASSPRGRLTVDRNAKREAWPGAHYAKDSAVSLR